MEKKVYLPVHGSVGTEGWRFYTHRGSGESETRTVFEVPLDEVPDSVEGTEEIYLRHYISRDDTLALGPEFVDWALDLVFEVWPLYRFYLAGRGGGSLQCRRRFQQLAWRGARIEG